METSGWQRPQQQQQPPSLQELFLVSEQQRMQQQVDPCAAAKRGCPASSKGGPPRKKVVRTAAAAKNWDKIPCLICNKPYQTVAYLQKHMMAKHKICQPMIQEKCDFCGCKCASQNEIELHSEEASSHLANHTGAVAQLRQDQLRKIVREESGGRSKP